MRAWHGAVGISVRATGAVPALTARGGERLSDLVPTGTGRVLGMAGADLRRLQTGLAHHYYTLLVAGFAPVPGLLIFGA
ncbi:hypothetical protein ILP92_01855 [Maribius pontilimi]|uniref:Uncharacterized protein n=1 Tax=Palleronia pontilimi TaxID=1964209 RepID=A0A934I9E3_9RHOB|nr:hypothetical protein [Palleronia pontilimi]MBJ3761496.1 hypothetical protein [Palleronia pontilimi]